MPCVTSLMDSFDKQPLDENITWLRPHLAGYRGRIALHAMTETIPTADSTDVFYAILGEPIPKNTQLLRTADEYRHFRTIYSSQKQLNRMFSEASLRTEVRLVMIDRTSEIPRKLSDLSHATCVIIFGPNFPWLSEATVRLWASSGRDRYAVVCHDKKNALFSWERLQEIGRHLNVRGYQSSANQEDTNAFWAGFFKRDLRPLIERKTGMSAEDIAAYGNLLSGEEVTEVLENDHSAMDCCRDSRMCVARPLRRSTPTNHTRWSQKSSNRTVRFRPRLSAPRTWHAMARGNGSRLCPTHWP